ncbi:hypothetical protein [Flavobacterium ustbae]|uniref:hypothetical protein n=1 Tax=Flavobacterium ustbae TaxID=2488790 RepID=UPI000F76723C|nr:hypothetical protein [Flavobacterium ustbae]
MNFFDKFFDFVFDERKKISSKAAIITLVIFGIFLINNLLGVSQNYIVNNKIEQIEKLNIIISNPVSDSITIKSAQKIRQEILSRKTIFEHSIDYFDELSFNKKIVQNNTKKSHQSLNDQTTPNSFWFYFTSSGIYYILGVIMIFLMFLIDKVSTISQRIAVTLILVSTFWGIGQLFYWICSLIPMILTNSWGINYFFNLMIQIGSILLFIWINNKVQKL